MKAVILVVEDEVEIAELISLYLEKEGFTVIHAENAENAVPVLDSQTVDLLVLDINLPGIDGFEFLQIVRKSYKIPVVIVSARQDDADIILGLGIGADDYVTKPFSPKVLTARVRANLRRFSEAGNSSQEGRIINAGPFVVDSDAYMIKKGGKRISVSPREFEVFLYLLKDPGMPKTPEEIYSAVWGSSHYGDITTVAVHIQRLRKKLEENPQDPRIIETVHGMGYRVKKELVT